MHPNVSFADRYTQAPHKAGHKTYIREHKDADARVLVVQFEAEFPHNTLFPKVIYELDRH
jgi:hypothetical protein